MNPPTRRCWKCKRRFIPNPRLGDRQVTCGRPDCQRQRHADRCRQWHERNREVSIEHYAEVVKPFRHRQPSYQRRWRLARKLREIRETIAELLEVLGAQLGAVVARGRALSDVVTTEQQSGVFAGQSLQEALVAATAITAALGPVGRGAAQLGAMGL